MLQVVEFVEYVLYVECDIVERVARFDAAEYPPSHPPLPLVFASSS